MDLMIEAKGVTKRFGKVEALAGLDLDAPSRSVMAILGPNGSALLSEGARRSDPA